jgi:DNA-directed RNA polymerase specialized sigma24 family protein
VPEAPRPPRPVALPPEVVALVGDARGDATPEAELLERLDSALRLLPAPERRAVMTAYASGGGVEAVAAETGLSESEASALTHSAVQLLRGALADLEPDAPPDYPTFEGAGLTPKQRPQ